MQHYQSTEIRLVASTPGPFVMGINYWPRKKAMYWWKEFDAGEVRAELAEVAPWGEGGAGSLLWEDFQPEPWVLDPRQIDNLTKVMDAACDAKLLVMPAFFTGNMSGIFWLPDWAVSSQARPNPALLRVGGSYSDRQVRDLFDDPFMLRAELFQIRGIVSTPCQPPCLFGGTGHDWMRCDP